MKETGYNTGDQSEKDIGKERMSKKTLKVWLSKNPPYTDNEYIGELFIDNDQFVAKGETADDTKWLNHMLETIWETQRGVPSFRKSPDGFAHDEKGKLIIEKYLNHINATADELLESVYDYFKAFGVMKVELNDR